jgi:peptidylprolyl isomerase
LDKKMSKAQEGDTVTVSYEGVLDDGSPFDSSTEEDPLTFILGESEVLPGFERAVIGMEIGQSKTISVPPEDAYGLRLDRLVEDVAIDDLPKGLDLTVGNNLEVTSEEGTVFNLLIVERKMDRVILDANHPLAGSTLSFSIELLEIDRPTFN